MTTRKIKVNQTTYTRTIKDKHHSAFDQRINEPVPWVQMKGKWLAKAGFNIDTPIKIKVSNGRLVLIAEQMKQSPATAGLCFRYNEFDKSGKLKPSGLQPTRDSHLAIQ